MEIIGDKSFPFKFLFLMKKRENVPLCESQKGNKGRF